MVREGIANFMEQYRNRLEQTVRVYNHGQKAYKSAQQLLLRIDDKVHNEFSYYARAKTSIVKGILDDKFDSNFDMAVNDAFGAARHILNDCLDLVVAYATHETMRLSQICKYTTISDVYSDFPQVKRTIDNIAHAISHSRSERGIERVDSYIGIVESDSYQKLLDYCHDVQVIEDNLKSKKKSEKNAATKFAIVLSASLCGAVWAIYKFYTVVYPPTP